MKDEERRDPARTPFSPVVRQHSRRRLLLPPFVTRYLPQMEHRRRTGLQLLDRGGGGATLPPPNLPPPAGRRRMRRCLQSQVAWPLRCVLTDDPPRWSDCSHRLSRTANPSTLKKETCQIHVKPGFDSSGTRLAHVRILNLNTAVGGSRMRVVFNKGEQRKAAFHTG